MPYLPLAVLALMAGLYAYHLYRQGNIGILLNSLRWIIGGGALLFAAILGLAGRVSIASMLGLVGASVLIRGRLGPIDFNTIKAPAPTTSRVRSRFFDMVLDHDSGAVHGKIIAGSYARTDLMDLGENDTRVLLQEVSHDPDSLSLLEAWLDANRSGWREYFAEQDGEPGEHASAASGPMDSQQAYEILGLSPGATSEEIKSAHHRLLKAVHPDQGGSTYLAARINAAKDCLLKQQR